MKWLDRLNQLMQPTRPTPLPACELCSGVGFVEFVGQEFRDAHGEHHLVGTVIGPCPRCQTHLYVSLKEEHVE